MKSFILKRIAQVAAISSLCIMPMALNAKTLVNVDGVEISDSVFNALKQQNPSFNYDALPEAQKQAFLDELVAMVLAANAAKKEGLDKSEEYKMMNLQGLAQLWLSKQGESLSKTIKVTDAEAKEYYNANKAVFAIQNAKLNHIVVAKEDEAKNIIAEIGKVPKNKTKDKFVELAKKYSLDNSNKANGGLIDQMNLNDPTIAPEFANEAKQMAVGSYTKTPVKTRYGYHVIYLEAREQATTQPFDKVKNVIMEGLKQQKMQQAVAEKMKKMRDNAKITYGK